MTTAPELNIVVEIEQEVLGALMVGSSSRDSLSFLRDYHFLEDFHVGLFRAISSAYERFGNANPAIVKQLIPKDTVTAFEANSGRSVSQYLAALAANTTLTGGRSVDYAKNVVEQWARISIVGEAQRASQAANDPSVDISRIVHETASKLDNIMSEVRAGRQRRAKVSIGVAAGEAVNAAMEAKDTGGGLTGITWGLADINKLTGGIQKRDLTLIGARPSMGKTTLGLSVAMKAAKAGDSVAFFSLEMDAEKIGARALSDYLYDWNRHIPYVDIIRGNVSDDQIDMLAEAQVKLHSLPIFIDDQSSPSVTDIRVRTERLAEECARSGKSLSGVFIDHLGLIKPSSRYQGNRNNEIGEITSALKGMARDLDVAVVLLSQLNRAVENRAEKVPQLSDLRDSGAIEQDADMIAFLYREAYYLGRENGGSFEEQEARADRLGQVQNNLEFHIAKQRNGPVTKVDLFADMAFSAIRNGARQ
jgi:replicative DNA helicase